MKGHVDAEALALCREGMLGRRATARVRAHLSSCSRCAEIDAGLAAVPALLALTGAPPMPAELATRLEAIIAAEATARAADAGVPAAASAPGDSPASGVHPLRGRPGGARKVLAFAAAAVVVVGGGGGYLLSRLPSGSGASSSSAAAPATAEGPAARAGAQPNAVTGGGLTVISSGTDYRPGRLAAQVATVLARYAAPVAGAHMSAPASQTPASQTPAKQVQQPSRIAALPGCVARIAAGRQPRLVDESRYDGRPATIIVLAGTGRAPAQVWVVGPACSAGHSDVVAHTVLGGAS
jgi:hypothetical protein